MHTPFHTIASGLRVPTWGLLLLAGWAANAQYSLVGSARIAPQPDCYQLTRDVPSQTGAVWYNTPLRLTESFSVEFTINFGNNPNGADGVVLVLQTAGKQVLGSSGLSMGFGGISPSLGVEFDTHQNRNLGDPQADHIALVRNGIVNHQTNTDFSPPVPISATATNVKDGRDHLVSLRWNAPARQLSVSVDCSERISQPIDLTGEVFAGENEVYWGFTSSTGSSQSIHTVCLLKEIVQRSRISVCRNESVQLVAKVSGTNQYAWQPTRGLDNPSSRTPTLTATASQLYTVTYMDRCSVRRTDSVFVEVKVPDFTLGADRRVCEGAVVDLSPQFADTPIALQYRWSTGATTRQLTPTTSGLYALEATAGGCTEIDSVRVTFVPQPRLNAPPETIFDCPSDQPLLLDPQANGTALRYTWTPGGTTEPTLQTSLPGQYTVRVSTDSACFVKKTFTVLDNCVPAALIFLPSAFTPNGDGLNDVFRWKTTASVDARMTIYSRWGEVVFYSEAPDEFWDGTTKGTLCPESMYTWQFKYRTRGSTASPWIIRKGAVLLMR